VAQAGARRLGRPDPRFERWRSTNATVSPHVLGRGKWVMTTGSLEIAYMASTSPSRQERRRRRSVSITRPIMRDEA
jgi:hypothetical protein